MFSSSTAFEGALVAKEFCFRTMNETQDKILWDFLPKIFGKLKGFIFPFLKIRQENNFKMLIKTLFLCHAFNMKCFIARNR